MLIINKNLGKNVARYRKDLKLSRVKLASIVRMNTNHLYRIETGRSYPKIIILAGLVAGLGVSIEELVGLR